MHALVTSGGTREPVDDVRVLTNRSTGRLGAVLVDALTERGHQVTLLHAVGSAMPRRSRSAVHWNVHSLMNEASCSAGGRRRGGVGACSTAAGDSAASCSFIVTQFLYHACSSLMRWCRHFPAQNIYELKTLNPTCDRYVRIRQTARRYCA